jgi:putative transposase
MDKFKGKYRIASTRLATWNYGSNAIYFVTICTTGRTHYFGEVIEGEMTLSQLGQVAADCWQAIPEHFPFVVSNVCVVMPNHVHGMVVIDKAPESQAQSPNHFGPQSQNLASIVRGYKVGVTMYARRNDMAFSWQARYHDRVIRNEVEYEHIKHYIEMNPQQWAEDTLYS